MIRAAMTLQVPPQTPLRAMFLVTSLPVGGAETLLVNLIRRAPRDELLGEICCLKEPGPLGVSIASEIRLHHSLLRHKWDVGVIGRLSRLFRERRIDAVVTVGCGDKMFWGRLAARRAGVPVIVSALHSTGWPDGVGRLNRWLTPITDAFIAVADAHGEFLAREEGFPRDKVTVIRNGVDLDRFRPDRDARARIRRELAIPPGAHVGILVAALRPEKNHRRFLRIARAVRGSRPESIFLIVGDGPLREELEAYAKELDIASAVRFLGNRDDTPALLAASDCFMLTSDNEALPVSILEAMACGLPVVASDVGSIHEIVAEGITGYRVRTEDEPLFTSRVLEILRDEGLGSTLGGRGRSEVEATGSLDGMVAGYSELLRRVHAMKR